MTGAAAIVAPLLATSLYSLDPRAPYLVVTVVLLSLLVIPWPTVQRATVSTEAKLDQSMSS